MVGPRVSSVTDAAVQRRGVQERRRVCRTRSAGVGPVLSTVCIQGTVHAYTWGRCTHHRGIVASRAVATFSLSWCDTVLARHTLCTIRRFKRNLVLAWHTLCTWSADRSRVARVTHTVCCGLARDQCHWTYCTRCRSCYILVFPRDACCTRRRVGPSVASATDAAVQCRDVEG